ncbi:alpha/beta fold hydrolase [Actinomycetes bacterium M1A6_2h]
MPAVARGGFEISYDVRGNGRIPLVLVAGLGLDSSPMRIPAGLLRDDFRCILIDNRGTGRSTGSSTSFDIDDMADDVVAVMDHMGLEEAYAVGWSMGGSVLQSLLVRRPDRICRAVLLSAMPRYTELQHAWLSATRLLRSSDLPPEVGVLHGLPWLFTSRWLSRQTQAMQLASTIANSPGDADNPVYFQQSEALRTYDIRAELNSVVADVLVLVGAEDVLTPPEQAAELAGAIPGARLEVLPRGGHGMLIEYPDDVASAIRRFLIGT